MILVSVFGLIIESMPKKAIVYWRKDFLIPMC